MNLKRTFVAAAGLSAGLLILGAVINVVGVRAASCNGWYGRRLCWQGYFNGQTVQNGGDVIPGGIQGVVDKQTFINTINGYLNSGDAHLQTSAQFIILSMLGNQAGVPKQVTQAQYQDWVNRINSPQVVMRVENATFACGVANTYYQGPPFSPGYNDIAAGYASNRPYYEGCDAINLMIDFYAGGNLVYRIRVACGNPLGDLPGLPANQLPQGSFDAVNCSGGGGWALDLDSVDKAIVFKVYIANQDSGYQYIPAGQGTAGTYRPDVNQYYQQTQGINVGDYHGFLIGPLRAFAQFNPREANTVQVNAVDQQTNQEVTIGRIYVSPCVTATCGQSTMPAAMTAGSPVSFTVSDTLSDPYGAPYTAPTDPTLSVAVRQGTNPSGNLAYYARTQNYTASGDSNTITSTTITFTPTQNGPYTLYWDLSIPPGANTTGNANTTQCGYGRTSGTPNMLQVAYNPYFRVDGGDVAAGPGFGQSCSANNGSGIEAFNSNGNNGGYLGAGSQLGAFALGGITSFATATNDNGQPSGVGPPSGLAFANTTRGGNQYGGSFGQTPWCVTDYVGAASTGATTGSTATTVNVGSLSAGTYVYNHDITLTGATLGGGKQIKLVVTGGHNVIITGNITYAYNSIASVPQLQVLVGGGNIYVASGVTELHGFFAAQGSSNGTGLFDTCYDTAAGQASNDPNVCNKSLTVYGAVAASDVVLARTLGNVNPVQGVPGDPAERFVYSPELWLPDASLPVSAAQANEIDSITSLPPVL